MIFNKKNQGTRGKLHNFIEEYKMRELYPLHMPGHKQNFGEISQYDYTEIPYFDDLHDPSGLILDIMAGYSKIYGVDSTYLSINGSTGGILAAISALNLFGKNFLVARNCHKSVYNAIFINKIKAKYFGPYVNKSNIVVGYDYDDIEREIVNNNIGVLILTSPTYEGIKFDLSKVYDICKKNKVLIMVDAAHGAHIINYEVNKLADIVIQSIHKTLPALTSTAIVHCNNKELDIWLKKFMSIYQTSSPSYILISSLSKCLEYLEENFLDDYNYSLKRLESLRSRLTKCRNLNLFKSDDPFKLVIECPENLTGRELYDYLYTKGFVLELFSDKYVIAMTSVMDDWDRVEEFVDVLIDFDRNINTVSKSNGQISNTIYIPNYKGLSSNYFETIDIDNSLNRVAAESIYIYPPGVPIITYGEVFDRNIIDNIKTLNEKGLIDVREIVVEKKDIK